MEDRIVKDKQWSMERADEVVVKLMLVMSDEVKKIPCEDDPAENTYIILHIISNLMARVIRSLDGYSKIYGIEMTEDAVKSWCYILLNQYLKMQRKDIKMMKDK